MIVGALLVLIMAVAVAGVAITVYPALKRYGASMALGYVGARTVEAVLYVVDVISLLSLEVHLISF